MYADPKWAYSLLPDGKSSAAADPWLLKNYAVAAYSPGKPDEAQRVSGGAKGTALAEVILAMADRKIDKKSLPALAKAAAGTLALASDPANVPALMVQARQQIPFGKFGRGQCFTQCVILT